MMSPGLDEHPEHRIVTEKINGRVEIFMEGDKIAESRQAIRLLEPNHPERIYIPKSDLRGIELIKFDDYHCPFKGHGVLYNVKHGSSTFENTAWSYNRPYEDMMEIKNLVAFYQNKVQFIRVTG